MRKHHYRITTPEGVESATRPTLRGAQLYADLTEDQKLHLFLKGGIKTDRFIITEQPNNN